MVNFFAKLKVKLDQMRPKKHPTRAYKKHPWLLGIGFFILFIILFFVSALGALRAFLPYYGEISGFPFASKNYLIVFQNNHELRPSGGFISAYGIAKFRSGFLTDVEIADVYGDVDKHPFMEPPYPMKELLANRWYQGYRFRDANYDANFPKTAEELIRMFHLTKPDFNVDGVIALNYSFLENLFGALGEVKIENEIYDKDSLFQKLEQKVNNIDRHNVEDLKKRKDILKLFVQTLKKKILLSPFKLRQVSDTIVNSLSKKEIQMYFRNAALQKFVVERGFAGQWPFSGVGDFLSLVEANLGGMKSDRYIKRDVLYHLTIQENPENNSYNLISDVTININHYGIENIPLSGQYSGFFRLYVPRGASLIEVSPEYQKDLWQKDEDLYHIFGNIVKLKPGQKTQLHYRYRIPASVLKKAQYELYIPKQSGANQDYYTVIFEAPAGNTVLSKDFIPKENFGIFQGEINKDWHLNLGFQPDKNPPVIIYQNIDQLGVINITFNEKISSSTAEDPLNHFVEDLDVQNPKQKDSISIDHIEYKGKSVLIFVKGMTSQPEEHYRVTIKNISDIHGNLIDPSPKQLTVVQRL